MKGHESIEKELRNLKPKSLPVEWREEILGAAPGARAAGAAEVMAALLPRPLLIGLAAAWILILVLRVTMPGGDRLEGVASERPSDRASEVSRVVLAERMRVNITGELGTNGTL